VRRVARDPVLRAFIQERLEKRWSPEQIAAALRAEFPEQPDRCLAVESIYQAIYATDSALTRTLRTGRHRRRPHRRGDARRPRGLPAPMLMIEARPAHVADRAEVGHWESQWCCQAA
jgi:IS30 family transposase